MTTAHAQSKKFVPHPVKVGGPPTDAQVGALQCAVGYGWVRSTTTRDCCGVNV
jgi:hypothetical protein